MRSNKLKRLAAVGLAAGLMAVVLPATSAHAADEPVWPAGSDGPLYLLNGGDYITTPTGAELIWDDGIGIVGSPIPLSETPSEFESMYFDIPEGGYSYTPFISLPGQERDKDAWQAQATTVYLDAAGGYILAPTLTPSTLIFGSPGAAALKVSGGTFSLGVAIRDQIGNTVLGAYYTTINVDAGTGNYKFATPPAPVEKEDTTTTVAASSSSLHTGESVTLTATVAPAAATGNVQFFAGSTSLGSGAVAAGEAVLTTTALPEGTNSVTAVYGGDGLYNGSTSEAITVAVTQLEGPDSEELTEANKGSVTVAQTGFNVTVSGLEAYNGQRVNVWGYSAPTFLGAGNVTGGQITVPTGSLSAGEHQISVTLNSDDSIIGWSTVVLALDEAEDSPQDIPVHAVVRTSVDGAFQLVVPTGTEATIGDPELDPSTGESVSTGDLPAFTVIDDRIISHRGWTLTSTVDQFEDDKGNTIENTAFGLNPNVVDSLDASEYGDTVAPANLGTPVAGPEQVAGTAVYASTFAELEAGKFNPLTTLDADLSFRAPIGKPAGTYDSTLTLTLVSK